MSLPARPPSVWVRRYNSSPAPDPITKAQFELLLPLAIQNHWLPTPLPYINEYSETFNIPPSPDEDLQFRVAIPPASVSVTLEFQDLGTAMLLLFRGQTALEFNLATYTGPYPLQFQLLPFVQNTETALSGWYLVILDGDGNPIDLTPRIPTPIDLADQLLELVFLVPQTPAPAPDFRVILSHSWVTLFLPPEPNTTPPQPLKTSLRKCIVAHRPAPLE